MLLIILDIDECSEGIDNCHEQADCENTEGFFTCTCRSGFSGNGELCEGEHSRLSNFRRESNSREISTIAAFVHSSWLTPVVVIIIF